MYMIGEVYDLLDNLLRKLMATGQSLSDEKLLTCIDSTLKSDVFPKLNTVPRPRPMSHEIEYTRYDIMYKKQ